MTSDLKSIKSILLCSNDQTLTDYQCERTEVCLHVMCKDRSFSILLMKMYFLYNVKKPIRILKPLAGVAILNLNSSVMQHFASHIM